MAEVVPHDDRQPEVSLNFGAELDDEDRQPGSIGEVAHVEPSHELLFGDFTPGEVPDLRADVDILVALEASLHDLDYLSQDLHRTGGMTQGFAMEAQRLLPTFDGAKPLGYYTKEPSATRYKVALEELHKGVWALIAAAAAALVAAIVKLIAWMRAHSSDEGKAASRARQAQANEETLKTAEQKLDDLKGALKGDAATMRGGHPEKMITMKSLMDDLWDNQARYERAQAFLSMPDPVYRDIVQDGPYSKAFRQLAAHLGGITNILRLKLSELEKVSRIDKHSFLQQDKAINQHMLEIISTPVRVGFGGKSLELREAGEHLASVRGEVQEQGEGGTKLDFDQLMTSVIKAYRSSEVVKYFEAQAEITKILEEMGDAVKRLQKTAGDLSTDGSVGHNSEGVGQQLRDVIFQVGKEIAEYRHLFGELTRYGMYLERLTAQAVGFAKDVEQQLLAMDRRGLIRMPEQWKHKAQETHYSRLSAIFSAAAPSN